MKEGSSSPSVKISRTTFLVAFFAAAAVLQSPRIQPGKLLLAGLVGLVFVNILLFATNLFKALFAAKGKTEAELETLLVPALKGEANVVTQSLKNFCTYGATVCLGIITSSILFLALRHYRVSPW